MSPSSPGPPTVAQDLDDLGRLPPGGSVLEATSAEIAAQATDSRSGPRRSRTSPRVAAGHAWAVDDPGGTVFESPRTSTISAGRLPPGGNVLEATSAEIAAQATDSAQDLDDPGRRHEIAAQATDRTSPIPDVATGGGGACSGPSTIPASPSSPGPPTVAQDLDDLGPRPLP